MSLIFPFSINANNYEIVGKWEGRNPEDGILIFNSDKSFYIVGKNGKTIGNDDTMKMEWETIREVEPHQIYILISSNEKIHKQPLGIYKIKNNKLIIRDVIEYRRRIGLIDVGTSRYEFPKDFSGILRVFNKLN